MNTLTSIFSSPNIGKLLQALAGVIVVLAAHSGTLPAGLEEYRQWIELAAYVLTGTALVRVDPKSKDQ
jgi:hypothetical protein